MRFSKRERRRRMDAVLSFPSSGLNKADFCRGHNIPVSSFDHWCRAAEKEQMREMVDARFVEVEVTDHAAQPEHCAPDVEVQLPFGVTLRFFGVRKASSR